MVEFVRAEAPESRNVGDDEAFELLGLAGHLERELNQASQF